MLSFKVMLVPTQSLSELRNEILQIKWSFSEFSLLMVTPQTQVMFIYFKIT